MQQDTEFDGYELEIGKTFTLARGELALSFAQDSVSAEFSDGSYVPRITPKRNLFKASYTEDDLKLALSFKDASKQNDIADNETVTDGFQILNINLSKTIELGGRHRLTLAVFGKNLLDEVARNHSSFVKNEVPMAGRNLGLRATYSF
jgi:iron complex outermembrane receptor protein